MTAVAVTQHKLVVNAQVEMRSWEVVRTYR